MTNQEIIEEKILHEIRSGDLKEDKWGQMSIEDYIETQQINN